MLLSINFEAQHCVIEHSFPPGTVAEAFAFLETGNVRLACEVAKVGRSSHYRWLEKDSEYR